MKTALVLAGGKGLRLNPEADDVPKPMMRLGGRPILENIFGLLVFLGIKEVYTIVAYKEQMIRDYFSSGEKFNLKITYISNANINDRAKSGLSDAVLLLKDKISKPFLTMLGDEIYIQTRHNEMLKSFENYSENECDAMIGVFETENIEEVKKNYAVKIDSSNNVLDLEEKPQNPWNNLIGCGTYIFRPSVFNFIEKTPLSVRSGRKELADTMKLIVNSGRKIKAFSLGGNYVNINYREDFEKAEKLLRG